MRLHRLLVLPLVLVLALAACGSGRGAGWTYAPAASPTPVPSGAASGSPASSPAGSPAASGSPTSSGSPGASAPGSPGASAPAGATVTVVATTPLKFDTPAVETAADQPFTLEFDNQDATQFHNVVIQNPDGSNVAMGDTAPFTGPEKRTYPVPALAAGAYPFVCQLHPQAMTGTLTVK